LETIDIDFVNCKQDHVYIYPIYNELADKHFARHDDQLINAREVKNHNVQGMSGSFTYKTAALKTGAQFMLMSFTDVKELEQIGAQDCTDSICSIVLSEIHYLNNNNELLSKEVNIPLLNLVEGYHHLEVNFNEHQIGELHIDVNMQTTRVCSAGSPNILGFDLAIIRGNSNRRSVADVIRSTPAQRIDTPPEVGSAVYDDSELEEEGPYIRPTYDLKNYESHPTYDPADIEIVVGDEADKEEMLKVLRYIHDSTDIDTNLVMVDRLVHLYHNPDLIKVRGK